MKLIKYNYFRATIDNKYEWGGRVEGLSDGCTAQHNHVSGFVVVVVGGGPLQFLGFEWNVIRANGFQCCGIGVNWCGPARRVLFGMFGMTKSGFVITLEPDRAFQLFINSLQRR